MQQISSALSNRVRNFSTRSSRTKSQLFTKCSKKFEDNKNCLSQTRLDQKRFQEFKADLTKKIIKDESNIDVSNLLDNTSVPESIKIEVEEKKNARKPKLKLSKTNKNQVKRRIKLSLASIESKIQQINQRDICSASPNRKF
mmetsp:Transcript_17676/g.17387  ORF Transcript_17676/g.17387 Transcript_17676/m.17387 type:complete len:142 (-) Transcript_17676:688-1113(-)